MAAVDRAEVLEYASEHSPAEAAERYGISAATIRSWRHRAGATAVIEADEPQDLPGPTDWPLVEVEAELLSPGGHPYPSITDARTGVARPPQIIVKAPQMRAAPERSVQTLSDGQHLRLPLRDAAQLDDDQIVALGTLAFRIMGRRSASLDRYGQPLQLDAEARERLTKLMLLKIEPARVREPAETYRARILAHRQNACASAARRVRQGAGF